MSHKSNPVSLLPYLVQGLLLEVGAIYGSITYILAWTMQQAQIPVSPMANISVISNTWRKVYTGHNLFQFLHDSSQQHSMWTCVNSEANSTCANMFSNLYWNIYFISYCKYFPFSFLCMFHPLAVKFTLINNKVWSLRSEVTWTLEDWRI
jgi:hypothetical protein